MHVIGVVFLAPDHDSANTDMTAHIRETDGAAAILERITDNDPLHERSAAKRELAEAMRAWPGEKGELWSTWFSEASKSLGLRTKTLECTVDEAYSLARNHASIVCYREQEEASHDMWLAVLSKQGRTFEVLFYGESDVETTMSASELKQVLETFSETDQIRCVVIPPNETSVPSASGAEGGSGLTPLQRLWHLLRPEGSDIWLVGVFAFAVSMLMLATPIAVEALVNTIAFGRFLQPIAILAVILLTFLGFRGAMRAMQTYVVEIIQRRLFARVAGDLAFRLPRTDQSDDRYEPELVNRFFDVVTVQKAAAQLLLDGLGLAMGTLIGMAVLAFYHPWLLGFDLFLLLCIAVIILVLGRGAVPSAVKESKHKYYMAAWLEDIAKCPTTFRTDGGAELAMERADRLIHEYLDARGKHFRILMRQVIFALALHAIASTVLLGLGGWLVVEGELTLGQLVAAELIVTVIVGSFAKLGKHMESFYDLLASVDKLGVLFDIPTEREDGLLAIDRVTPGEYTIDRGQVSMRFDAVRFAWPGSPAVIRGLSAEVSPGDRIAIWGLAGSGKSTLVDMIGGLRDPSSGHLTIDGFNPRDIRPDVLRRRVATVRGGEVFHGTVEENVHLHRADVSATDDHEVMDALGLLEPVLRLQDGCSTMLESDGSPLSESQCRLLAIARGAVGRPGLLVLDGTLDTLGEQDLDHCLAFLTDPRQPWTLLVTTAREDIAARIGTTIELESNVEWTRNPVVA